MLILKFIGSQHYTHIILTVLSLVLSSQSCGGSSEIDRKALYYTEKANRMLVSPGGLRSEVHNKVLAYLDSAILADKRYKIAYANKIRLLNGLKRHQEALDVTDQLIALDPHSPNAVLNKGFLLIKLNHVSADNMFKEALILYDIELQKEVTEQLLLGRSLCLYFLEGKEACLDQMHEIKGKFPGSRTIDNQINDVRNKTKTELVDYLL